MSLNSRFKSTISFLRKAPAIITVIGLLAGSMFVNADELTIFSKEKLTIGARAVVNAGSIQSETDVLVGNTSSIKGAVYSNGTAYIRYNAHIYSDLLTTATQTLESGAVIDGYRRENTEIPFYTLQTKNVCIGCSNLTIPNGYYCNLQPGYYNDITVQTGGKLYLAAGTYYFRTLNVCYNARVYVNISSSQYTTVNVRDYINVADYAKISLICATNTPSVNFYTNQCSPLYIGKYASVEGCFTAPYAEFTLLQYGSFTGSVNANKVTIYQDATVNGELARDSDGDDAPNVVEYKAGTDPYNEASKPALLKEGNWENRTAYGEQVQVYDFSHFVGYEKCDAITMQIPQNNLTGDLALIYTASTWSGSLPDQNFKPDASSFTVKAQSQCYSCMLTPIPLSAKYRGTPKEALALYRYSSGWTKVPIEYVTFGAVYAELPAEGKYVVARAQGTYLVSTDFTAADLAIDPTHRFKTLYEAMKAVDALPSADGDNIFVATGTYKSSDKNLAGQNPNPNPYWSLSKNTNMYGGYKQRFDGQSGDINLQEPKLYEVKLLAEVKTFPILGIYAWALEENHSIVIDGFTFEGLYSTTGIATDAGAIEVRGNYTVGPEYVRIRNCVFIGNSGIKAGAVELQGQNTRFFFDNCIFTQNSSTGAYTSGASGSAVAAIQVEENGNIEAEFYSCVFSGNNVLAGEYAGTIATSGRIIEGIVGKMPIKVVNCTFYNNTVAGTYKAASICNGANYEYLDNGVWKSIAAPAVVLNSILFSNTAAAGNEVSGITTDNVTYTINSGALSIEFTEKGISHTAIHDATIGALNNNITLTTAGPGFDFTEPVTDIKLKGGDDRWGTGDDGLNLSITSLLRSNANKARPTGLKEHNLYNKGTADVPVWVELTPYYRANFPDAANRTRAKKYINDFGSYEKHLNILCIGDELTLGNKFTEATRGESSWSYRATLKESLLGINTEANFVGKNAFTPTGTWWGNALDENLLKGLDRDNIYNTVNNGTADITKPGIDVESNGYAAATTASFSTTGTYAITEDDIKFLNPDVVIIMIGSYELWACIQNGDDPETDISYSNMVTRIQTLVNNIHGWLPNRASKKIFYCNLPKQNAADNEKAVGYFNDALTLTNTNGKIDVHGGSYPTGVFETNKYTFKKAGHETIATQIYNAIKNVLP